MPRFYSPQQSISSRYTSIHIIFRGGLQPYHLGVTLFTDFFPNSPARWTPKATLAAPETVSGIAWDAGKRQPWPDGQASPAANRRGDPDA